MQILISAMIGVFIGQYVPEYFSATPDYARAGMATFYTLSGSGLYYFAAKFIWNKDL